MSLFLRTRLAAMMAFAIAALLIAGCASPVKPANTFDTAIPQWQGRLLVKVAGSPPTSFSSSFELQGNAQAGQLAFTNPLGTILARIAWTPDAATLQTISSPQTFESLDALTLYAVGAELPVTHLFDWLQGQATPSPGWQVDLSSQPQGRLSAHRSTPRPEVDLRIVLE